MEIKAWYRKYTNSVDAINVLFCSKAVEIIPEKTHICLPVTLSTSENFSEVDHCLSHAFMYFNWTMPHGEAIAESIQPFVRDNKIHTSMSVGDVIELVDTQEFYLVESVGFRKLDNFKKL